MIEECKWKKDINEEDEPWQTDCGTAFILITGSPKDNNYKYCPNCGRQIKLEVSE